MNSQKPFHCNYFTTTYCSSAHFAICRTLIPKTRQETTDTLSLTGTAGAAGATGAALRAALRARTMTRPVDYWGFC